MTSIMIHEIENIEISTIDLLENSKSFSQHIYIRTKEGSFDITLFSDKKVNLLF